MSTDTKKDKIPTQEELLKTIAELEAENARTGDELAKANTIIALSSKTGQPASVPIPGTFKVEYEDVDGQKVKKTVKFKDGAKFTRLKDGAMVDSALLMNLASGKELSKKEKEGHERLAKLTTAKAKAELTRLVSIGYSLLEEVEK